MRKVDRLKKLHAPIDDKYKKIDTTVNGDAERLAELHRETEKGEISLTHRPPYRNIRDQRQMHSRICRKKAQDVRPCTCCRSERTRIKTCGHG